MLFTLEGSVIAFHEKAAMATPYQYEMLAYAYYQSKGFV